MSLGGRAHISTGKDAGQDVTLVSNDVWGSLTDYNGLSAGSTDISMNPEFVAPLSEDYRVTVDSRCTDAETTVDGLQVHQDGDTGPRPWFDIGADE